jgi:diguanylate cyclase (GGDEF)-like protein
METVREDSIFDRLDLTAANRILEHAGRQIPPARELGTLARVQALIDVLCELSVNDGLTGLVNPTFFQAALARELDRTSRTGRPCALMTIDVDRFKPINDTHGHHVGDRVLQAIAIQLKKSLRSMDTAARTGGDEFAVILPECAPEDAVSAATRIHALLNPLVVASGGLEVPVTCSAGVVWTEPRAAGSVKTLVAHADAELYRAKRAGRRRLSHPELAPTRVTVAEHAAVVMPQSEEDAYGR